MESLVPHLQVENYLLDLSLHGEHNRQKSIPGDSCEGGSLCWVVFCPNLERMAFHWDLPWVPLTSTPLTWLVSMTSSSTGISAYFLERCPAGHTQLMFALGSCDCSQPCAHSEHESVAKSINPMGLRPIFHWIWALKPVELNLVSANTTFWIGIKLQFYNMIFKPKT